MKHKFEKTVLTDVVGVLDYDKDGKLTIFIDTKDDVLEVNVGDLLKDMVGTNVQIKSVFEKE